MLHRSAASVFMAVLAAAATAQQPAAEVSQRRAEQIRKQIVTLPNYGVFDYITFRIDGGSVTLGGFASRPTLKSAAENVVKNVEGVEAVENTVEVLPVSRADDDVRAATYKAIYGHASLSRYDHNRGTPPLGARQKAVFGISKDPPLGAHPIHIVVKNGNVRLEGVVDTEGDKNIATAQARSVSGVFSVTNNLQVHKVQK